MTVRKKLGDFPSLRRVRAFFERNSRRRFRSQCIQGCALVEATGYAILGGQYGLLRDVFVCDYSKTCFDHAGEALRMPPWATRFVSLFDDAAGGSGRLCVRILDAIVKEAA